MTESNDRADQPGGLIPIGSVVAQLQRSFPDVSHSSLRFLEREGLVEPVRTPGGHRLYRASDIARVRQIKTWQAQRLSLDDIRLKLADLRELESPLALANQFLDVALQGDHSGAARLILHVDELGMPLTELFGKILRPVLSEVGARWSRGTLLVGQEKEISELVRDLIAELSSHHAEPGPSGPVVVAACVAGELHELGLLMVVGLLRERGWRMHYLGADVDPRFLREAVRLRTPSVVLLSATTEERIPAVTAAVDAIVDKRTVDELPVVVVGGKAIVFHHETLRNWGAIPAVDEGLDDVLNAVEARTAEVSAEPDL